MAEAISRAFAPLPFTLWTLAVTSHVQDGRSIPRGGTSVVGGTARVGAIWCSTVTAAETMLRRDSKVLPTTPAALAMYAGDRRPSLTNLF